MASHSRKFHGIRLRILPHGLWESSVLRFKPEISEIRGSQAICRASGDARHFRAFVSRLLAIAAGRG